MVIDETMDSIYNFEAYLNLKRPKSDLWVAYGIFEHLFFEPHGQFYVMVDENS